MADGRVHLRVLYERFDARAAAITASRPDWPCRRGCDECCRTLAAMPIATRAEWEDLWQAYERLPLDARRTIRSRVLELVAATGAPSPPRHYVCPFLDREAGACQVYEDRLGACRLHGFYTARDGGRWCSHIEALAASPAGAGVVWGHHEGALEDLRAAGGEPVTLAEWLAERLL